MISGQLRVPKEQAMYI